MPRNRGKPAGKQAAVGSAVERPAAASAERCRQRAMYSGFSGGCCSSRAHRGIEMDAAVRVQPDAVEVARDRIRHRHGLRPGNARDRAARVVAGAAAASLAPTSSKSMNLPSARPSCAGCTWIRTRSPGFSVVLVQPWRDSMLIGPVLDLPRGLPAVRSGNLEEHPRVRVGPAKFRQRRPRACAGSRASKIANE